MDWWKWCGVVHAGETIGEVVEESLANGMVNTLNSGHESGDFVGAFGEAGSELGHLGWFGGHLLLHLEVLQVFDGHLQDVGLLQFGMAGVILFEGIQDEILEFGEAVVDASPSAFLHNRFGTLQGQIKHHKYICLKAKYSFKIIRE